MTSQPTTTASRSSGAPGAMPGESTSTPRTHTHGRGRSSRGLRAAAAALAGLGLLLGLAACNSASGSGSGSTPPSSGSVVTVQGTLRDIVGNPLANVKVLIGNTLASTAADGSFTISKVSTPYDLALYLDASTTFFAQPTAIVYDGLTVTSPTLVVPAVPSASYSANLSGDLGRSLDGPNNEQGVLMAGGQYLSDGTVSFDASKTTSTSFTNMFVGWGGSPSQQRTMFALTADTANGVVFTGYAAMPLTVDNGVDQTNVTVALSTQGLGQAALNGSVTAPSGYTLVTTSGCNPCRKVGSSLMVRFTSGQSGGALFFGPGNTSSEVPTLANGPFDYALVARAEPSNASNDDVYTAAVRSAPNLGTNASNNLTLHAPPSPITPANNATGVTSGTSFSWQTLSNSIYGINLSPDSGAPNEPQIIIVTAGSHTTLPDLSQLGVQLPASTLYDYGLTAIGPFSTVDAAAAQPMLFIEAIFVMDSIFPTLSASSGGPLLIPYPVPDLRYAQGAKFLVTTK